MENSILDLITAIQNSRSGFDWASAVSAVCSVISLFTIVLLLKERSEKKRPYLQVSFELVRGSLICLVIRNVGETPASLKAIKFNEDFVKQLPTRARKHTKDKENLNISVYPQKQWVICLDTIAHDVLQYKNTRLEVTLVYTSKQKKKRYTETEIVDFNDYTDFIVYISEIDELKEEIKKLGNNLNSIEITMKSFLRHDGNISNKNAQKYAYISDKYIRTIVTGIDATEAKINEVNSEDGSD